MGRRHRPVLQAQLAARGMNPPPGYDYFDECPRGWTPVAYESVLGKWVCRAPPPQPVGDGFTTPRPTQGRKNMMRFFNPPQFPGGPLPGGGGMMKPILKPGALQPLQPDLSAIAGAGIGAGAAPGAAPGAGGQQGGANVLVYGGGYGVPYAYGAPPYGPGCYTDPDGNYCCPQGDVENCTAPGGYQFVKTRGKTLKNPCGGDYVGNPCGWMEANPRRRKRRSSTRYRRTRRMLGL